MFLLQLLRSSSSNAYVHVLQWNGMCPMYADGSNDDGGRNDATERHMRELQWYIYFHTSALFLSVFSPLI